MKKSLGKIFLFLLLIQSYLLATQLASYELKSDKTEAMLKEPIEIFFTATQLEHSDNMFFLLKPKKSEEYKVELLQKNISDKGDHNSQTSYKYILFPLKTGDINVSFEFTIQTASDKAVAQSYVDDHDDSVAIQMINKKITIKPLHIHVKKYHKNVNLFGDFKLKVTLNRTKTTQYDDVSLVYTIEGKGYENDLKDVLPNISNVTKFSEVHTLYSKLTPNGYSTKKIYTYALSGKNDFDIPKIHLKAYSFQKHAFYTLSTKSYKISVSKIDTKSLLDRQDIPFQERLFQYKYFKDLFIYILIFLAGFISAKLCNSNCSLGKKERKFLDVHTTKSPKELIIVLLNTYPDKNMENFIYELEKLEYRKSKKSFSQIKKEVLKQLST